MADIIDVSRPCNASARDLSRAGVKTVIRYYTRESPANSPKRLKRPEAEALAAEGLRLAIVYEGARGDNIDYFEYAAGLRDGAYARTYGHEAIAQPAGSAIYFAVDADATAKQISDKVIPYFKGVGAALADATGEPSYVIGVYGSGAVCQALLDAKLVGLSWLAQSTGWMGYQAFLGSRRWTLYQNMPSSVAGVACDPDVAADGADIGDFTVAEVAPRMPLDRTAVPLKRVVARSGLRLRAGPGVDFEPLRLLSYGSAVSVLRTTGSWSLVDLHGDGAADGYVSTGFLEDMTGDRAAATFLPTIVGGRSDASCIAPLIAEGSSAAGLAAAAADARAAWAQYPHNGCAAHLSALLRHAGIDVPMTLGAGKLAHELEKRGWQRISVGGQLPGDVGVAFDTTPPEGADHVYLVIQVFDGDRMVIADNQNDGANAPHERYANPGHGKTATDYFLRAV